VARILAPLGVDAWGLFIVTDSDRFRFLFGPYRTPRVRIGRVLTCEARDDDVIVTGYSDAPIPWLISQRRGRGVGRPAASTGASRPGHRR
jgi:hypothetical protein